MSSSEVLDIRTATITEKGQICIPTITRELNGFKKGTKVSIISYKDRVELRPLRDLKISEALGCMIASEKSLAKNWLSKEDEEAGKNL